MDNLHNKIQRLNGFVEVAAVVIPGSDIPVRIAQILSSSIVLFKKESTTFEKAVNIAQVTLSLVGVGLSLSTMFNAANELKIALKAIDLIYQGTLLGVWGESEVRQLRAPQQLRGH